MYVCMCMMCAPGAHKDDKTVLEAPETGVINDRELPRGCWDLNVGPLHDQQVLFRVEPSLQPLKKSFKKKKASNRKTNEDKERKRHTAQTECHRHVYYFKPVPKSQVQTQQSNDAIP